MLRDAWDSLKKLPSRISKFAKDKYTSWQARRVAKVASKPKTAAVDAWYKRMWDHGWATYAGWFALLFSAYLYAIDHIHLHWDYGDWDYSWTTDWGHIYWPGTILVALLVAIPLIYLLYKWRPWSGTGLSFGFVRTLFRALLPLATIAAVVYFVYWYRGYTAKVRTENYQAYVRDSVSADSVLSEKMKTAQALPYPDSLGDTVRVLIKVDSSWSPVYTRHAGCKLYWMPTDDEESRTARIVIKTPYEVIVDNPGDYVYAQYEVPRAEFKSLTGPTELLLVITVEDPRKCKHPFPVQHESPSPNTNRPPLKYASQG